MTAFLYRAGSGVAGDVTRQLDTTIEPGMLDPNVAPTAFGVPVKLVAGKFRRIESGDTAEMFQAILSRVVPSISGDLTQTFQGGSPDPKQIQGFVVRGYVNVICTVGTPVRGGPVYMRVLISNFGTLDATADGINNVLLVGVTWAVDGKDANNLSEIRIM